MAQLRHDYPKFKNLDAEILVMLPNGPRMIEGFLKAHPTPYHILTDKGAKAAGKYLQVKQFFSLGTPCVFLVDKTGCIRYAHYAKLMIEEPDNERPLAVLKSMQS